MNLMYEELARAHQNARLSLARDQRRGVQLSRARRLTRRADRTADQVRLVLARSV